MMIITVKEFKKILSRFPKDALIKVLGNENLQIIAQCNQDGKWSVDLTNTNEETIDKEN